VTLHSIDGWQLLGHRHDRNRNRRNLVECHRNSDLERMQMFLLTMQLGRGG
jgi:hypothetical protein